LTIKCGEVAPTRSYQLSGYVYQAAPTYLFPDMRVPDRKNLRCTLEPDDFTAGRIWSRRSQKSGYRIGEARTSTGGPP
jgi:hypothetical protein